MGDVVPNSIEILGAFRDKGWNLYEILDKSEDDLEMYRRGSVSEIKVVPNIESLYYLIPRVRNHSSALDIEVTMGDLAGRGLIPPYFSDPEGGMFFTGAFSLKRKGELKKEVAVFDGVLDDFLTIPLSDIVEKINKYFQPDLTGFDIF